MEDITVSICCITYNHEQYIAKALDSFLNQETSFKYEILIHDDASTDRTPEIIREYEELHPEIIKPIYQSENKYSKGERINPTYNYPRAKGRYLAICEGDDYWIDVQKLEKQVNVMKQDKSIGLCTHSGLIESNDKVIGNVRPFVMNKFVSTEEIIKYGGGIFPTGSMLIKAELVKTLPKFYYDAPVGDLPLFIYLSLKGKVYYIAENMSVYRKNVPGSWSERIKKNKNMRERHYNGIKQMYENIDKYTNFKYSPIIKSKINNIKFRYLLDTKEVNVFRDERYKKLLADISTKDKIKGFIKYHFPIILRIRRIYRK